MTTAESGAGSSEAGLLAAVAIENAANGIRLALDEAKLAPKRYIIFTGAQRPNFGDYHLFQTKVAIVRAAYQRADEARTQADGATGEQKISEVMPEVALAGAATAIGATLDILKNLGSYFRADFKFSPAIVTGVDSNLLAVSLAGKLRDCWYPARWSPAPEELEPYQMLDLLSGQRDSATRELRRVLDAQKNWTSAASEADAAEKRKRQNIADLYDTAAERYSSANKGFDDLFASLAEVDSNGIARVTRIAEQKVISVALAEGALAILLQVAGASGTTFTKRDLWTFFGGAPFYVSGGAIASFLVVDDKGSVKAAGQQHVHSGFMKVQDVPKRCNP